LQFLLENSLKSGFKEMHKLAVVILSIPAPTAYFEKSFSAKKLRMTNTFYDAVTENFLQKERRIHLIYN
jgi:hypothetical protein